MTYSSPGVFNALDDWGSGSGLRAGNSTLSIAQANTRALQATIDAAVNFCETSALFYGAVVLIPSNNEVPAPVNPGAPAATGGEYFFAVNDPVADTACIAITCRYPLLILGTGSATVLQMKNYSGFNNGKHLFLINNSTPGTDDNIGGVTFQDLQVQYDVKLDAGSAIFSQDSQNVRIFRCVFADVPDGLMVVDTQQFSLLESTCFYPARATGQMLSIDSSGAAGSASSHAYIAGCNFHVGTGAGTGVTGLIIGVADGLHCVDSHFDGFGAGGISIIPTGLTSNLSIKNCVVHGSGTQLLVSPQTGGQVRNLGVVNCSFLNNSSDTTVGSKSATILDAGSDNANIDTVRFVSSVCLLNPASGLEIRSGQNIEVLGGSYSCNGQLFSGAGIWLNGPASNVRIVGAIFRPSIYGKPTAQLYAVIIGSGASSIFITDCDVGGYGGTPPVPISFSSGISNVEVTDCEGYNDQGTLVSSAPPTNGVAFNGLSFATPYYGPVTFFTKNGNGHMISEIDVYGHNTGLRAGSFFLAPGSSSTAKIQYSSSPLGPLPFLMIGE